MRKLIFFLLVIFLLIPTAVSAKGDLLSVYYTGPKDSLWTALTLDKDISLVTDPATAQVFILNGQIPAAQASTIRTRVQGGAVWCWCLARD
jgi:hypothetical protein